MTKPTIIIPTYWAGPGGERTDRLINIYDHPTPLDEEGTIERTLKSLTKLNGDFNVCIIGIMTEDNFLKEFEEKLTNLLIKFKDQLNIYWFSHNELEQFHNKLSAEGLGFNRKYVSLEGYSNIRNLCIIIPHILGSEVAILVDDDEVVEDADYVKKCLEYMGEEFEGQQITGKTGYYVDKDHSYLIDGSVCWWDYCWKKGRHMNEVLKTTKEPPRLKKTPLALGGAMIIHRSLFEKVAFDPWITRGEDIDYLINAKLQGIDFYLDNEVYIVHLPPPKTKNRVLGCRQDYFRFIYEALKIKAAFKSGKFHKFDIGEFDSYPGVFLRRSVLIKAPMTTLLMSLRGIFVKEDRQQYKNIGAVFGAIKYALMNKKNYFRFQKGWPSFMNNTEEGYGQIVRKI